MNKKDKRIITFFAKEVELITDESSGTAFASISRNPNITWIKFILLDNKPNGNKHRIPAKEFDNVIRTGAFMPLKMAFASKDETKDHEDSKPLGVITHLVKNEDLIEAIAALWNTERKEDVQSIKEAYSSGKDINVSWELHYTDSEEEDGGVVALRNIAMNAATIVDIPAYGGRTPVIAVAEINTEGENMDTIEKAKHDEIVSELNDKIKALETERDEANGKLESSASELEELREFKNEVVAEQQKVEKLDAIKERFVEAGLEVKDEFFTEREEFLLGIGNDALEFYIQDMVAFASKKEDEEPGNEKKEQASKKFGTKVPNLDKRVSKQDKDDYKTVADFLKSRD